MSFFFLDEYEDMEAYIPGEQPKDRQYIKLNANESSFPPSPKVLEAVNQSQINGMGHYSDPHCMEGGNWRSLRIWCRSGICWKWCR